MTSSPRLAAAVAVTLAVAALGVMAIASRRVGDRGSVRVTVDAPLGAAEMESRACVPVETTLAAYTDEPIVSRVTDGTCVVVAAASESDGLRDAIAALPLPGFVAIGREGVPLLELVVSGARPTETTLWASEVLRPALETVTDVARVEVCGVEEVVVVRTDAAAMTERSVTRETIAAVLSSAREVPSGSLDEGGSLTLVAGEPWDLGSLPVATGTRLDDVATVSRETFRTCGEGDAITVSVAAERRALAGLRERLAEVVAEAPPDVRIAERPVRRGLAVWILGRDRDVIASGALVVRRLVRSLGAPEPTAYLDPPARPDAVATITADRDLLDVTLDGSAPAAPIYRRGGSAADVFFVAGLDERTLRDALLHTELPTGVAIEVVSR